MARRLAGGTAALVLLLLVACGGGDSSGPGPGGGDDLGTLSGTVRMAGQSAVLQGATITVGVRQTTSDASGHFELADLPAGAASVKAELAGYITATVSVTISAGANTRDLTLAAQEVYLAGSYAVFVPAGVGPMRGVIISLGGGVTTSGFVTGGPLEPGNPTLEQSLQALGASLRGLAASAHVALLGTTIHSLPNNSGNDNALFATLASVATASGHAELANAPVLTFGLDAGSLEAGGLASRVPDRTIGVLMRVPTGILDLTDPSILAVPTFVMLSELDADAVTNMAVESTFAANRSRGGLWALSIEPGVHHAEATPEGNSANIIWIAQVLARRLPAVAGDPLVALGETSGWLGDLSTLEIAAWASFTGDPTTATWLPSQPAAQVWQSLVTAGGAGGSAQRP